MGLAQYDAQSSVRGNRFYFSGTSKLRKGQVLCYDLSASKTTGDPNTRLGAQVVDIAASAANKNAIAGIVDSDAGKTGPCYVELLQPLPGDQFDAETDGTTDIAAGDVLKGDNTLGALIKDASSSIGVTYAKALEANTLDAAKTVIRCLKV